MRMRTFLRAGVCWRVQGSRVCAGVYKALFHDIYADPTLTVLQYLAMCSQQRAQLRAAHKPPTRVLCVILVHRVVEGVAEGVVEGAQPQPALALPLQGDLAVLLQIK